LESDFSTLEENVPNPEENVQKTGENMQKTEENVRKYWTPGDKIKATVVVSIVTLVSTLLFFIAIHLYVQEVVTRTVLISVGIIVIGVLLLVVALTVMTLFFASRQLTDRNQPLGLPEGSIRAVIALMLIVIFAVAAIFLYSNIAVPYGATLQALTSDQLKQIPVTDMLSEKLNADNTTYTVVVVVRKSAASEDFAKQLLTVISTLVVSISSFYFGSRVSETAHADEKSPTPTLDRIEPNILKVDDEKPLTIYGKGLLSVDTVTFETGDQKILGVKTQSSDSQITTTIKIPQGKPTGLWNVTVSTSDGKTAKLEGKLTVTT
jgi:hypothetical protein